MVSFIAGFVQFSCAVAKFSKKGRPEWQDKNFNIKTSTNTNPPNKTQFDDTKGKVYENWFGDTSFESA